MPPHVSKIVARVEMKAAPRIFVLSSVGLALFAAGFAFGQQSAPKDYRGVQEDVLATIDLAKIS
jgi:hypothetical protein